MKFQLEWLTVVITLQLEFHVTESTKSLIFFLGVALTIIMGQWLQRRYPLAVVLLDPHPKPMIVMVPKKLSFLIGIPFGIPQASIFRISSGTASTGTYLVNQNQ